MRISALAAVVVAALAGCTQASPEERQRLISTNVAVFAPVVEGVAVGAAYGYATRYDHDHYYPDYSPRWEPTIPHHEPPPPAPLIPGPTFCRPGIGGRGTVCN